MARQTPTVSIVPATPWHGTFMDAMGFRQDDIDEWVGGIGGPVLPALMAALDIPGSVNEVILRDNVPLCMWGSHDAGLASGVGLVWLIATKAAERHVLTIHRHFKAVMEEMHKRFPLLLAYTHPRNRVHHLWMRRNGFEVGGEFITSMGIPYLIFRRTAS